MVAEPPPSSPGPRAVPAPAGMLATGAHLGAQAWWCEQLFAVAGGWVPTTPEAPARVHLAEVSRVLGDSALALRGHLPRPAGVEPGAWVRPAGDGSGAVAALAADDTLGRLAGLHRVAVPRLLVAWAAHLPVAAVADRALARTLAHVHGDLVALWAEGEALVQAHVAAAPDGAATAAAQVARVESALVAAGGLTPDPPPSPPSDP